MKGWVVCRVEGQTVWLGILGCRQGISAVDGAGVPWTLSLLLPLQLPLPLLELMENEALEILTKALRSEPPSPPTS